MPVIDLAEAKRTSSKRVYDHKPRKPISASKEIDWCSEENAEKLVRMIRAYWEKRGIQITIWKERMHSAAARYGTQAVFVVRSDMVNNFER